MTVRASSRHLHAANQGTNREIPLQITGNEEVQVAIVIIVEKAGTYVPAISLDAGLPRDVRKSAIAVVSVKNAISIIGHQQVSIAVVVVVPCGHAHAVARSPHTGAQGDVRKGAVTIVAEQPIPRLRCGLVQCFSVGLGILQRCAVHEKDVRPSIVVIIEDRHAAAHGLNQVLVRSRGVVELEVDSCRLAHFTIHRAGGASL